MFLLVAVSQGAESYREVVWLAMPLMLLGQVGYLVALSALAGMAWLVEASPRPTCRSSRTATP
ncbi:MAG: hypothetical protein WAW78_07970, partial [Propioniciclava sp.]